MRMAERTSEFVLRTISELVTDRDSAHKTAIMVTYIACHLLQLSWSGKQSLATIIAETDNLIDTLMTKAGDA